MIGQETHEVERKIRAILQILSDSPRPLGGRVVAQRLKEQGIDLNERTVRYHLKIMDERGFTRQMGDRDGRMITELGLEELRSALVCDKIGFVTDRLKVLAFFTSFDPSATNSGIVPIDVSLFPEQDFPRAMELMAGVFRAGLCISNLVAVAREGERLGGTPVPQGKIGLATISAAVVSGAMLKAGIPVDFRFGGILQFRNHRPVRFTDLIEYYGSTVDPFEVFVAARMTSVSSTAQCGDGNILASFQELPLPSKTMAETILRQLQTAGLCHASFMGKANELLYEIPVKMNKVGLVIPSGLNAAAAAAEAGIPVTSKAMNGITPVSELKDFYQLWARGAC